MKREQEMTRLDSACACACACAHACVYALCKVTVQSDCDSMVKTVQAAVHCLRVCGGFN